MLNRRLLLRYLAVGCFAFFLGGCSTTAYIWQASLGQWALYNHERPIDEVIQDPRTSSTTRTRLQWISDIKDFVEKELAVKSTSNYRTYVDLKRPFVVWALTSAEKYELTVREWKFPIVGAFPYLGFFKEETARKWQAEEDAKGKDTYVRGVQAYSTLGYLRDPLLSSMLSSRKASMVNLLFHETTHAYVFIKGEGSFNEQAASFIGDYGELTWIEKTYGKSSKEYQEWWSDREDRRQFGKLLREFALELRLEFKSVQGSSEDQKIKVKTLAYQRLEKSLRETKWKSENWLKYSTLRLIPELKNNAALLAHLTYEDNQDVFQELYDKCKGSLKDSLAFLKSYSEIWEQLRSRIDQKQSSSRSNSEIKTSERMSPQEVLKKYLVSQTRCAVSLDFNSH